MNTALSALSPLDGRYHEKVQELCRFFSEEALMRYRVRVECEWLIFLTNDLRVPGTRLIDKKEQTYLKELYGNFETKAALRIKELEKITNHDLKAVEYFIRERLQKTALKYIEEFVHFGCTSEDINNLSYALAIKEAMKEVIIPSLEKVHDDLMKKARAYKGIALLSRTHGQPASPTTLGKEFVVFAVRLERQLNLLKKQEILGKINGASGNFNAHVIAYPKIDWIKASKKFIGSLGLVPNLYTTQIEPHDFIAGICDGMKRINAILIDLNRDMWSYISLEVFRQKIVNGEVGSSAMPHKVNPIDFENSEGNLGVANALWEHFAAKLPISRLQRDLSDSTVFRNLGMAFGYSLLAYKSTLKGFSKLEVNREKISADLDQNWPVLAEAIQTVLRRYQVPGAYEKLKELTRGKKLGAVEMRNFIENLKIPPKEKQGLLKLKPDTYTGLAEKLVEIYLE